MRSVLCALGIGDVFNRQVIEFHRFSVTFHSLSCGGEGRSLWSAQ